MIQLKICLFSVKQQSLTQSLETLNIKKATKNGVGNSGHGQQQAQTCGGLKPINQIPIGKNNQSTFRALLTDY